MTDKEFEELMEEAYLAQYGYRIFNVRATANYHGYEVFRKGIKYGCYLLDRVDELEPEDIDSLCWLTLEDVEYMFKNELWRNGDSNDT